MAPADFGYSRTILPGLTRDVYSDIRSAACLTIICDMAVRFRGIFSDCDYPEYFWYC